MKLSEFNQHDLSEAELCLQHCVNIPSWITQISQARPFTSQQALLAFAKNQTDSWTWQEIKAALDTHPRIGEKKAAKDLSNQEEAFSNQEQANVQLSTTTEQQLLQGNIAYEQKFGYIFLIKAAGLTAEQILAQLHARLNHSAELEQTVVKQNLAGIALLRLSQAVTE
ncbi:2-oxo-4-hydroxy-4-carboxy-5-ureidoimidazoline decarboxylase [Acinetobacter populi]|uniref:2-oxo-4-hydroxy-4-carboxy-5-ureidoimidazoline decarboxylase n=1 Tax=Acinetobacter populi TaxID=1582270 RepID=A0A1Z9YWS3_9GAMM|nr:2-oxo-4-hydroxy-4-carboxy-5-ureidoimidazoline decarboxylase [Acinetobacter populi]OUY06678.1 OHCU decarboxylase [Acinetobacter populi]